MKKRVKTCKIEVYSERTNLVSDISKKKKPPKLANCRRISARKSCLSMGQTKNNGTIHISS